MRMNPLRLMLVGCLVGCLAGFQLRSADAAVSLSDLIDSAGSIVVDGSLMFDQFSYSATNESPPATGVLVDGYTDAFGNLGIRIHGGFSDSPGGGDSLATLSYRVSTIDPGSALSGALLAGNPAAVGIGSYTVDATLSGVAAGLSIFDISPGSNTHLLDSLSLPSPLSTVDVALSLKGSSTAGGVTLSFIDQTYTQTDAVVPEPSSLVIWTGTLMLFGIVLPLSQRQWRLRSLSSVKVKR
ncbi:MAG: hypothetical protein KDB23_28755 [Planctomycetales bacterium]|nr:hypothetical protein [Planctomycetales bacterium]